MRHFYKVIFAGSEDYPKQIIKLKKRLHDGLTILSGLQQPARSSNMEEAKRNAYAEETGKHEMRDIAADVSYALGVLVPIPTVQKCMDGEAYVQDADFDPGENWSYIECDGETIRSNKGIDHLFRLWIQEGCPKIFSTGKVLGSMDYPT